MEAILLVFLHGKLTIQHFNTEKACNIVRSEILIHELSAEATCVVIKGTK